MIVKLQLRLNIIICGKTLDIKFEFLTKFFYLSFASVSKFSVILAYKQRGRNNVITIIIKKWLSDNTMKQLKLIFSLGFLEYSCKDHLSFINHMYTCIDSENFKTLRKAYSA